MKKTLISLESEDKEWLEKYSHLNNQSLAESIRQAVKALRKQSLASRQLSALSSTAGLWKGRVSDALVYQRKIRSEWD